MKLDNDPFPVNMMNFEGKKVLVRLSQAESTKGKSVIIGDNNVRPKMIKPKSPEIGRWKVNEDKNKAIKKHEKPKLTFDTLLAKYESGKASQKRGSRPDALKRPRSPPKREFEGRRRQWEDNIAAAPFPPFGPLMPMMWGSHPMVCPPCPP
jgi:hypothetical protein